jgi:hypothetical protein
MSDGFDRVYVSPLGVARKDRLFMSDSNSDLCPCGSGLRAVRCCRLELQTPPSAMALRCLAPLTEQAIEAHRRGDSATAERLCRDVLELAPELPK